MPDLENPWVIESPQSLLITFEDGRLVRYAIRDGQLLYKQNSRADWLQLSQEQMLQHITMNTIVGEWLKNRSANQRPSWKLPTLHHERAA